jgi:hypothetical protein
LFFELLRNFDFEGEQDLGARGRPDIIEPTIPPPLQRLKRVGGALQARSEVDARSPRRNRGEGCVVIDLTAELTAWLRSIDARTVMKEIVAEAVQSEIRSALEAELLDVERAATVLGTSEGALRKAVERGQVPCQRVGKRLRFRRMDLLSGVQRVAAR